MGINHFYFRNMGSHSTKIAQICQIQRFGLLCEETTDRRTEKQLVILVKVCNNDRVVTRLIDMWVCNVSIADNIFTDITSI